MLVPLIDIVLVIEEVFFAIYLASFTTTAAICLEQSIILSTTTSAFDSDQKKNEKQKSFYTNIFTHIRNAHFISLVHKLFTVCICIPLIVDAN